MGVFLAAAPYLCPPTAVATLPALPHPPVSFPGAVKAGSQEHRSTSLDCHLAATFYRASVWLDSGDVVALPPGLPGHLGYQVSFSSRHWSGCYSSVREPFEDGKLWGQRQHSLQTDSLTPCQSPTEAFALLPYPGGPMVPRAERGRLKRQQGRFMGPRAPSGRCHGTLGKK